MLKAEIIGNLGADAVVRNTKGSNAIGFSVAHNEKYKDSKGVVHEKTIWVNCTLWRTKETKLTEFLKKGQMVFVEGTPSVGVYQNREGQKVADFQLRVTNITLLSNRSDNSQPPADAQPHGQTQPARNGQSNGQYQQQRTQPPQNGHHQQQPNGNGHQPVYQPVDDVDTSWIDD